MQTDIYDGGTSSFFQTYRWHSNSNKIPFWLWSNTKHLYFRCFFGLRFWVGIYLWVTPQNSDLWPTGFPSALGVRDSLPVNKSAVIRGYKTGAVSFGLENAPGTYYQRLQINPNGTVVYYYLPEGATTLKTATLVHLEDLLWLCWRQQNSDSHSLLKIKSTSGTINLGAWKSVDLRVPVTAPEGYTPIGLMSFDTAGAIPICINAMMISTVEVTVGLTNPSADTANNTGFTLSALYIKSTFVC